MERSNANLYIALLIAVPTSLVIGFAAGYLLNHPKQAQLQTKIDTAVADATKPLIVKNTNLLKNNRQLLNRLKELQSRPAPVVKSEPQKTKPTAETPKLEVDVQIANAKMTYDVDKEMWFDLQISCNNKTAKEFYVFAWAQNDYVTPPARGVWPIQASQYCLSPRSQLWVNEENYKNGYHLILQPEQKFIHECGIFMPVNPATNKPLANIFTEMQIRIYSDQGERIYKKTFKFNHSTTKDALTEKLQDYKKSINN